MRLLSSLSLLISLAAAQYGEYSESPSSTSSTAAATSASSGSSSIQTVSVGKNGLSYDPSTITADVGSKIVFQFYPGDHSVAQADFNAPCKPAASGFYSGFINSNSGPSSTFFTLTINDTNPIWFYCAQVGHCAGGMVGVINPPASGNETLDMFKSAASSAGAGTQPQAVQGGVVGAAPSSSGTGNASASGTSSPSASASTKAGSSAAASEKAVPAWTALVVVMGAAGGFASWIL